MQNLVIVGQTMVELFNSGLPHLFYALLRSIKLHFAANRKVCEANYLQKVCDILWSWLKSFARNSTLIHQSRHFRHCFRFNFWPEAVSDVIFGVTLEYVSMDVFGDSRSNRSRDIRAADFVVDDERRRPTEAMVVMGRNSIWRFAWIANLCHNFSAYFFKTCYLQKVVYALPLVIV